MISFKMVRMLINISISEGGSFNALTRRISKIFMMQKKSPIGPMISITVIYSMSIPKIYLNNHKTTLNDQNRQDHGSEINYSYD